MSMSVERLTLLDSEFHLCLRKVCPVLLPSFVRKFVCISSVLWNVVDCMRTYQAPLYRVCTSNVPFSGTLLLNQKAEECKLLPRQLCDEVYIYFCRLSFQIFRVESLDSAVVIMASDAEKAKLMLRYTSLDLLLQSKGNVLSWLDRNQNQHLRFTNVNWLIRLAAFVKENLRQTTSEWSSGGYSSCGCHSLSMEMNQACCRPVNHATHSNAQNSAQRLEFKQCQLLQHATARDRRLLLLSAAKIVSVVKPPSIDREMAGEASGLHYVFEHERQSRF
jgi:hypothetical protein